MESVVEGNETFRADPTAARPRRSTISMSTAASQVQPTIDGSNGSGHHSRARSYGVPAAMSRITSTARDQPVAFAISEDLVLRASIHEASAEHIIEDSAEKEAAPAAAPVREELEIGVKPENDEEPVVA